MKENEKRKFAEEVDKLELLGGGEGLERCLKTDFAKGIGTEEEERRMREEEYGNNKREVRVPESKLAARQKIKAKI